MARCEIDTRRDSKPQLLLVEDNDGTATTFGWALRGQQFRVAFAQSGAEGVAAARRTPFDLLIVDLRLPDMSGIEVIQQVRASGVDAPFIVISGYATVRHVVEAMRLGAANVLEKPLDVDDLVDAVRTVLDGVARKRSAIEPPPAPIRSAAHTAPVSSSQVTAPSSAAIDDGSSRWWNRPDAIRSTADRWALLVLKLIDAPADPKTIGNWARAVNISRSALSEYCRLAGTSPHHARDFARTLRAICRSGKFWRPDEVMDIADARTLRKLQERAGLTQTTLTPTVSEFLDRQQWIPKDNPGFLALRRWLSGGADSRP